VKWKKEAPGMCCKSGHLCFPSLSEDMPQLFKNLWIGTDPDSTTFRKNARRLNNSLSLTSLKVAAPKLSGRYRPSVLIQGKVAILIGPLKPQDQRPPIFAQLYVLDPEFEMDECKVRLRNATSGKSRGSIEQKTIERLIQKLQGLY